jgi:hypothetical protein
LDFFIEPRQRASIGIRLENDDRRVWVHRVFAEQPWPDADARRYHNWIEAGGTSAVYGWLMQRDISTFDPMARPPMTTAKRTMLDQSQPLAVQWLRGLFGEGGPFAGRTVLTVRDLMDVADHNWTAPKDINTCHATSALGCEGFTTAPQLRVRVRPGEEATKLWVCDRSGLLGQLPPTAIKDRYLAEDAASKSRIAA